MYTLHEWVMHELRALQTNYACHETVLPKLRKNFIPTSMTCHAIRFHFEHTVRCHDTRHKGHRRRKIVTWLEMYGVVQHDTIHFLVKETRKFTFSLFFWSHNFDFLHKPIVYGVVHLLYSVVTSNSVFRVHEWSPTQLQLKCKLSKLIFVIRYVANIP